MREEPRGVGRRGAEPYIQRGAESIGAYLARQRKLRGLGLDEIESLTHIPRRSLERLEAGLHDRDPDGFVRGFVRTVAEAIGLDAEDTLARMLPEAPVESGTPNLSLRRMGLALVIGLGAALALALAPGLLRLRVESPGPAPGAGSVPAAAAPEAPPVRWDAVRELAASAGALTEPVAGAPASSGSDARPLPSDGGGNPYPGPGAPLR